MSDINQRIAAAMQAAKKIGTQNGSAPPHFSDNRAGVVYEALIANRLKTYAEARYEAAKQKLKDTGVIDDEYKPGDYAPFTSDSLVVTVKRNNDSTTLDATLLKSNLMKEFNWTAEQAASFVRRSSKPRKGNTTITVGVV